jgi:hypothetical protein
MTKIRLLAAGIITATVCAATPGLAQTSPLPGPTNPGPQPSPLAKPGSDMVINPTIEECQKGWHSELKWTKAQFDAFCGQMKISK